jgi:hypothetical protein
MPGSVIDEAFVLISPDVRGFAQELKAKLTAAFKTVKVPKIEVDPDTKGFGEKIGRKVNQVERTTTADIPTEPDLTGFSEEVRAFLARFNPEDQVKIKAALDRASFARVVAEAKRIAAGATVEVETKIDRDKIQGATRDLVSFGNRGGRALRTLRGELFTSNIRFREMANILGGATLPALAAVGSVGVPAVLALGAALSSAAGAAAAIGPSLAALGQGFGVAKLAFSGLGDALKAVTDAQAKLRAGGKLTEAQLVAIRQKLNALSPAGRRFVIQLASMKVFLDRLRASAQRNLFPGLTTALERLKVLFPVFNRVVASTARALGDLADQGARMVTTGPWRRDFATIGASNVTLLRLFGQTALTLAGAFRDILVVAGPMTESLARMVLGWANVTAAQIGAARSSGRLGEFFSTAALNLRRLLRIAGNVGGTLKAVFSAALPSGGLLLFSLEKATGAMRDLATSAEGGQKLREFFDKARPAVETIVGLLVTFARRMFEVIAVIGIATQRIAEFLDKHPQLKEFVATALALALTFKALNVGGLLQIVASLGSLIATAGPVGLVVAGIAALAGAFVLAYTHSQPFRAAVDQIVDVVQAHVLPALHSFAGFITGEVIPALERVIPFIRDQLLAGLDFLRDSINENRPALHDFGQVLLKVGKFIGTVVIPAIAMLAAVQLRGLLTAIGLVIRVLSNLEKALGSLVAFSAKSFRSILNIWLTVVGGIVHGAAVAFGWVPGVGPKLKRVDRDFQAMKNAVLGTLEDVSREARGWGRATSGNYAAGVLDNLGRARASALQIANVVRTHLREQSPAKEGPLSQGGGTQGWGKTAAELYAKGIRAGLPSVRREVGALAAAAAVRGAFGQQTATAAGVRQRIAGQGIHIENLNVSPLSGRWSLPEIMQEVRLAAVH